MVQSSSWEANWFAASQEILRISRNPNALYRYHKRLLTIIIIIIMTIILTKDLWIQYYVLKVLTASSTFVLPRKKNKN